MVMEKFGHGIVHSQVRCISVLGYAAMSHAEDVQKKNGSCNRYSIVPLECDV